MRVFNLFLQWILKVLKPFTLVAMLFLVTFGIYTNLYVFRLFSAPTLLAACMLPYIGYALGGTVSLALRQPIYRVKTIAIETGIQNTSIAYLLLIFSLPAPDGDMAAVGPMASAIMTPLPLVLLVIGYLLYKRFCRRGKEEGEAGHRHEEEGVPLSPSEGGGGGGDGGGGGGEVVDERNGNGNVQEKGEKVNGDGKGSEWRSRKDKEKKDKEKKDKEKTDKEKNDEEKEKKDEEKKDKEKKDKEKKDKEKKDEEKKDKEEKDKEKKDKEKKDEEKKDKEEKDKDKESKDKDKRKEREDSEKRKFLEDRPESDAV